MISAPLKCSQGEHLDTEAAWLTMKRTNRTVLAARGLVAGDFSTLMEDNLLRGRAGEWESSKPLQKMMVRDIWNRHVTGLAGGL